MLLSALDIAHGLHHQPRGETLTRIHYITHVSPEQPASAARFPKSAVTTGTREALSPPSSTHAATASSAAATDSTDAHWPWWQIFALVTALAVTVGVGVFIWWKKRRKAQAYAKRSLEARQKQRRPKDEVEAEQPDHDNFYDDSLFDSDSDGSDDSQTSHGRRHHGRDRTLHAAGHEPFRDSVFSSYGAMRAAAVRAKRSEADARLQAMLAEEARVESRRQDVMAKKEEREREKQRKAERRRSRRETAIPSAPYTLGSMYTPSLPAMSTFRQASKNDKLAERVRHQYSSPTGDLPNPFPASAAQSMRSPSVNLAIPPPAKMPMLARGALMPAPAGRRVRTDEVDSWAGMY